MNLFSHAPKPNTRIPPILIARQNQEQETATNMRCTKLADLSKQKLWKETSTGDPDLRRCLGHHRLLRRSIQEAQEDMKRYLGEVVEYEDDSDDEDDIDVENMAVEEQPVEDEDEVTEEEEEEELFDEPPNEHKKEIVWLGWRGRAREAYIQKEQEKEISRERSRSTCVKDRFVHAVRGLMRRHTSPLPLPLHLRAVAAGKKNPTLGQTLQKNNSCSNIPIYIHVHEHNGKGDTFATGLEKTRTRSTDSLGRRARGRRYAERLGIRSR